MTDMILERSFGEPLTPELAVGLAEMGAECFMTHRVDWRGSLLARDGTRMVCWFRGPDAESARTALRQVEADISTLWPGTVHRPPTPPVLDDGHVRVLVARTFDQPVAFEEIQALENDNAWCLDAHHVTFQLTFFSRDARRMLCLYQAPDAESVRVAQRQAGMPFDAAWPCHYLHFHLAEPPTD